jgi:tellurite resistance-related uncharacterized protein
MKRCHAMVVSKSQNFRQHPQLFLPAIHNQFTCLRIENVEVIGSFEHPNVFFDKEQIAIENRMHVVNPTKYHEVHATEDNPLSE